MKNHVERFFRALHGYRSLKKFPLFHKKKFVLLDAKLAEEFFCNQILTDKSDTQESPLLHELFLLVILPGIRQRLLLIMGRIFHSQKKNLQYVFLL